MLAQTAVHRVHQGLLLSYLLEKPRRCARPEYDPKQADCIPVRMVGGVSSESHSGIAVIPVPFTDRKVPSGPSRPLTPVPLPGHAVKIILGPGNSVVQVDGTACDHGHIGYAVLLAVVSSQVIGGHSGHRLRVSALLIRKLVTLPDRP